MIAHQLKSKYKSLTIRSRAQLLSSKLHNHSGKSAGLFEPISNYQFPPYFSVLNSMTFSLFFFKIYIPIYYEESRSVQQLRINGIIDTNGKEQYCRYKEANEPFLTI